MMQDSSIRFNIISKNDNKIQKLNWGQVFGTNELFLTLRISRAFWDHSQT